MYIKIGKKLFFFEVLNFENKYGKFGVFVVFCFDKVMFVINKVGYLFFGEWESWIVKKKIF